MTPKKQTNWITIPDEQEKAQAFKKPGREVEPVKYKALWAVGFVAIVIGSFAVLAPSQFSALIQGNLFDTSGIPQEEVDQQITPLTLLSAETEDEGGAMEDDNVILEEESDSESEVENEGDAMMEGDKMEGDKMEGDAMEGEAMEKEDTVPVEQPIGGLDSEDDLFQSDPAVIPEDEAVTIAIEPIAEAESIDIEPVTSTDESLEGSENGTGDAMGKSEDDGSVTTEIDVDPVAVETGGSEEGLKPAAPVAPTSPEEAAKDALIADLQQQLEQLESDRDTQNLALENLNNLLQQQTSQAFQGAGNLRPSAPTAPFGAPTGTVPAGVNTTATIGQPAFVQQPGFKVNPYRVSMTPEQVLQQNLAAGAQFAQIPNQQQGFAGQAFAQSQQGTNFAAQAALGQVNRTPDSGPRETAILSLLITVLALMGWKGLSRLARQ